MKAKKGGGHMSADAGFLLAIAGTAVVMDLFWMRVDNGWILFSLFAGFIRCLVREGTAGLPGFAAGAALPAVLLCGLFVFRMMGAGDIKLFCALGGIMGVPDILNCILVSFVLGAVISLAILVSCGGICRRIQYLLSYFYEYARTGKVRPYRQEGMAFENFHFTVPVFLSVVLYAGGVY